MSQATKTAGLLLFPGLTQLDLTGPYEVLANLPGWKVEIVAKQAGPVRTAKGMVIHADQGFDTAPQYDLFAIPGGPGTDDALTDEATVEFVRRQCEGAENVFGICTGSLLIGATGLLRGRRAGSHWAARHLLARFGAEVRDERMTKDGKFYTAGGVTSGIDMALRVVADIAGEEAAQQIQLQIEYDPEPPFRSGTPFTAAPHILARARAAGEARRPIREAAVEAAAARLASGTPG
ncbi:DJ-1/PfpI family protein [Roseococcus suduntuyensis]|uniref:Cyclohexyl-isocyanide hydratase n=1 Tax=Roseococcus suduntuyensis TaxID=455361 RepID=A0A840A6D9_9PROT|nr:DJ-1/PfpI family protein [Roseococcus suduntuyensis]MBB3897089.1 cyclohexyl-isocyanide hydratase [Roseococcus suduntuyensis]